MAETCSPAGRFGPEFPSDNSGDGPTIRYDEDYEYNDQFERWLGKQMYLKCGRCKDFKKRKRFSRLQWSSKDELERRCSSCTGSDRLSPTSERDATLSPEQVEATKAENVQSAPTPIIPLPDSNRGVDGVPQFTPAASAPRPSTQLPAHAPPVYVEYVEHVERAEPGPQGVSGRPSWKRPGIGHRDQTGTPLSSEQAADMTGGPQFLYDYESLEGTRVKEKKAKAAAEKAEEAQERSRAAQPKFKMLVKPVAKRQAKGLSKVPVAKAAAPAHFREKRELPALAKKVDCEEEILGTPEQRERRMRRRTGDQGHEQKPRWAHTGYEPNERKRGQRKRTPKRDTCPACGAPKAATCSTCGGPIISRAEARQKGTLVGCHRCLLRLFADAVKQNERLFEELGDHRARGRRGRRCRARAGRPDMPTTCPTCGGPMLSQDEAFRRGRMPGCYPCLLRLFTDVARVEMRYHQELGDHHSTVPDDQSEIQIFPCHVCGCKFGLTMCGCGETVCDDQEGEAVCREQCASCHKEELLRSAFEAWRLNRVVADASESDGKQEGRRSSRVAGRRINYTKQLVYNSSDESEGDEESGDEESGQEESEPSGESLGCENSWSDLEVPSEEEVSGEDTGDAADLQFDSAGSESPKSVDTIDGVTGENKNDVIIAPEVSHEMPPVRQTLEAFLKKRRQRLMLKAWRYFIKYRNAWRVLREHFAKSIVYSWTERNAGWSEDGLVESLADLGPVLVRVKELGMTYVQIAAVLRLTTDQVYSVRVGRYAAEGEFQIEHGNRILEYVNMIVMQHELDENEDDDGEGDDDFADLFELLG